MAKIGLTILLVLLSLHASADSYSAFDSKHSELKGQHILDVGDISVLSSRHDSSNRRTRNVYQVGVTCFAATEDLSNKAGLLVVNQYTSVSVIVISNHISSIMVHSYPAILKDCFHATREDFMATQRELQQTIDETNALIRRLKKQQQRLRQTP